MSLLETLKNDLNAALKQGERLKVETLRFMLSQLQYARLDCAGPADMGRLMKAAMAELKGRADGNVVSKLARQRRQQEGP